MDIFCKDVKHITVNCGIKVDLFKHEKKISTNLKIEFKSKYSLVYNK